MTPAELLGKTALIIVNNVLMTDGKLFKMVDVVLVDFCCFHRGDSGPRSDGLCLMLTGNYAQALPMVSLRGWVHDEEEMGGMLMRVYSMSFLGYLNSETT